MTAPAQTGAASMMNMSTALVIGIGGSGVQTLGRLRRAIRDRDRPDSTMVDNIHLLAMDAVSQQRQMPPLAQECFLADDEFFKIVGDQPINAYEYVRDAMNHDRVLRESWDADYVAPNEPLTDGLKRSRGLGDLAFEINRERIESQISTLFRKSLVNDDQRAIYGQNATARLPVVIVASACGGTGASGLLHVLHAVHRVAHQRNVRLQVYPVVYLPDVFADSISLGQNPAAIRLAHKSNAYAFLSELELVITKEGCFDELLARGPDERTSGWMTSQDIVSKVYLIDGKLSDGSGLTQGSAYQMVADALHALLLTDSNNRLGIEGTNAGPAGLDDSEPRQRRAYGSLGAFSITYPGATYRRYLINRTQATLIAEILVEQHANEVELGGHVKESLLARLDGLTRGAGIEFRKLRAVTDLEYTVSQLVTNLQGVADLEGLFAEDVAFQELVKRAATEMAQRRPSLEHTAKGKIDSLIDETLRTSGEGTTVLVYALDKARQELSQRAQNADKSRTSAIGDIDGFSRAGGELTASREALQRAWSAFLPFRAHEKEKAATQYAEVAKRYAERVIEAQTLEFSCTVLSEGLLRLTNAHDWARSAQKVLQSELATAEDVWRDDVLTGKDAGEPSGQQLLVPSDVLPQVEDSHLARAAWSEVSGRLQREPALCRGDAAAGATPGRDWLRSFYDDLARSGSSRGLLALGAVEQQPREQELALAQLRRQLRQAAAAWAKVEEVLPTDLPGAAQRVDGIAMGDRWRDAQPGAEAGRLDGALHNLGSRVMVPLAFDLGKIRLQEGEAIDPALVVVATSGSTLGQLSKAIGHNKRVVDSRDPERVTVSVARYGLTVGSVDGIEDWYQAYREVLTQRRRLRTSANQPPPHIKKSVAAEVLRRPLVRPGYRDGDVARLVVKAVAISDRPVAPVKFEPRRASGSPVERRYVVGQRTAISNDQIGPIGDRADLGHELSVWFDAIGTHPYLRGSIEEAFGFVLETALRDLEAGDTSSLAHLREISQKFHDFNMSEWERLRDLAGPDHSMERDAVIRGALVAAGQHLLDADLLEPQASKITVGA